VAKVYLLHHTITFFYEGYDIWVGRYSELGWWIWNVCYMFWARTVYV